MPSKQAQTIWAQQFKGQMDTISPGADPAYTPDLANIKIASGDIEPRGGINTVFDQDFEAPIAFSNLPIIGLFPYPNTSAEAELVALTANIASSYNTGSGTWGTISSVGLTGAATSLPQHTIIDDKLVFVNEGEDLPQKWFHQSGLSSVISPVSIPPFAKAVEAYVGFLMLGNVSDDGSFADVTNGHFRIVYSDDWENDWLGCNGNFIELDETPGAILRMIVLGKDLMCFKEDAIVKVTWVGGDIRFTQQKMKFDGGLCGGLAAWKISDQAIIFCSNDGVLYLLTTDAVMALSDDAFVDTIVPTIPRLNLRFARAAVNVADETFYLFFNKNNQAQPYLDHYVAYNYRDKSFWSGPLGHNVVAVGVHKWTPQGEEIILVATQAGFVARFDDPFTHKDSGVTTAKYYTTNWMGLGEEGWCFGVRLVFRKSEEADTELIIEDEETP